ncbi:MAG: hypothetical protein ACFWTI_10835 [Lactobacillus helveticus]|jgi:hypothetical protein
MDFYFLQSVQVNFTIGVFFTVYFLFSCANVVLIDIEADLNIFELI